MSHSVGRLGLQAWAAAATAGVLIGFGAFLMVPTAVADVPPAPAAAFNAEPCPGTTESEPTAAAGPVADLTRVFGQRLVDYNAGRVVALYDNFGENSLDGYPAVCGVRYVDGVGPVSEWMFCTDIFSHVCSGADASGNLVDIDGTVIPPMASRGGNPKLDAQQEKLIAWLIANGHEYQGFGYYDIPGGADARRDGDSAQRRALQTLVWCISDPVAAPPVAPSEEDRRQTCAASMSPTEQARLLAQIPDVPEVQVDFTTGGGTLEVGDTARFELVTNLYGQPIEISATGVAGTLSVISGPATYDSAAQTLTVAGTNPALTTTVVLGFVSTAVGTVDIAASATPALRTHLGWNQSSGVAADGVPCQVYATFESDQQTDVEDAASATFRAETTDAPTPGGPTDGPSEPADDPSEPTEDPTAPTDDPTDPTDDPTAPTDGDDGGTPSSDLPATGSSLSPLVPVGGVLLLLAGVGVFLLHRRQRDAESA